jgi:hypothetical protein
MLEASAYYREVGKLSFLQTAAICTFLKAFSLVSQPKIPLCIFLCHVCVFRDLKACCTGNLQIARSGAACAQG